MFAFALKTIPSVYPGNGKLNVLIRGSPALCFTQYAWGAQLGPGLSTMHWGMLGICTEIMHNNPLLYFAFTIFQFLSRGAPVEDMIFIFVNMLAG